MIASSKTNSRRRSAPRPRKSAKCATAPSPITLSGLTAALFGATILAAFFWWFTSQYTVSLQSPFRLQFQSPLLIAERMTSPDALQAQSDQHGHRLSAWQQYACRIFGPHCRVALAIQRAENPQGKCEIYHYNTNGTLDWGYFQINTVHLKRPGLNLRDLLDCKANIDFAWQLYREKQDFTPWSTYNSGLYRKFLEVSAPVRPFSSTESPAP